MITLGALFVYSIKSCHGIALEAPGMTPLTVPFEAPNEFSPLPLRWGSVCRLPEAETPARAGVVVLIAADAPAAPHFKCRNPGARPGSTRIGTSFKCRLPRFQATQLRVEVAVVTGRVWEDNHELEPQPKFMTHEHIRQPNGLAGIPTWQRNYCAK